MNGNGIVEERKVKIGLANWEWSEIIERLAGGERSVTSLERKEVKVGTRATVATVDTTTK